MNLSISELITRLLRETWHRRILASLLFVITALIFLVLGLVWPKIYTSSSTVFVEHRSMLQPLMPDTAVNSTVVDRAKIAREIVFSRKSIAQILQNSQWFDTPPSDIEKDHLIESLKKRTEFMNLGENLIRISFKDDDPKRAFDTATLMTDLFIDESVRAKQAESRKAFDFIDNQVKQYHEKLTSAEQAIKDFRSRNIDATPGANAAADERLLQLKRQVESVYLEIYEEQSKLDATRRQLAGESGTQNSASINRETQLSNRIVELEQRLAELRLTYMDDYPDIIQLKGQIENLTQQVKDEIAARNSGVAVETTELRDGPIAQELQRQALRYQTTLSSLKSRKEQLESLMDKERETKNRINAVEAELAELTRDNDVNRQMYQQLLSQRENARISMNIDMENQGLTVRIQESASLPVTPKGIRFAHIILAGLFMSLAVPVGAAFGLSLIDQKVRDAAIISEKLNLPILSSLYPVTTPAMAKRNIIHASIVGFVVISVWSLYGFQIYLRLRGEM